MTTVPVPLGPHHQLGGGETTSDWLKRAKPRAAVAVGDLGILSEADHNVTITFGRLIDDNWLDNQGFDFNRYIVEGANPEEWAAKYVGWMAPQIQANPWVDIWKGPNEQVLERDDAREAADPKVRAEFQANRANAMDWYARFEAERARLTHDHFAKACALGSWADENPFRPWNLWPLWKPALQAIVDYGGWFDRHSFAGRSAYGDLRVDYDHNIFAGMGFDVKVLVSEAGIDNPGWRQRFGDDINRYWNELLLGWCNDLQIRPWCASTLFTVGGARWPVQDVNNTQGTGKALVDKLVAWVPGQAPEPVTPPVDTTPYTHVVKATQLNVRLFPWTGNVEPNKVGLLTGGTKVVVLGTFRGWGALSTSSNAWVNLSYLTPL